MILITLEMKTASGDQPPRQDMFQPSGNAQHVLLAGVDKIPLTPSGKETVSTGELPTGRHMRDGDSTPEMLEHQQAKTEHSNSELMQQSQKTKQG